MTTFAESLKKEIARVSKKELRAEIASLRKASTTHRSDIAALKKTIKSLESNVRALVKLANRTGAAQASPAKSDTAVAASPTPAARGTFNSAAFAQHRKDMGLTQTQWAKVIGVSSLSVYKWESGKVQPRNAQLARIREAMSLGKRRAHALASA